jgi:hypothetical protein
MPSITEIADKFFVACETGKGWDGCKAYCTPDATFTAQAEPLADVKSRQQYCDWMKGLLRLIPDGGATSLYPSPPTRSGATCQPMLSSTALTPAAAVQFPG